MSYSGWFASNAAATLFTQSSRESVKPIEMPISVVPPDAFADAALRPAPAATSRLAAIKPAVGVRVRTWLSPLVLSRPLSPAAPART